MNLHCYIVKLIIAKHKDDMHPEAITEPSTTIKHISRRKYLQRKNYPLKTAAKASGLPSRFASQDP